MSTTRPGISTNEPRCEGSGELISTRTGTGKLIAALELMVSAAATVPFRLAKTFGSTETETTAGVTPFDGDTRMPFGAEIEKGVLPPPGSTMVSVWVLTLRSQKFPRKTRSGVVAFTRG